MLLGSPQYFCPLLAQANVQYTNNVELDRLLLEQAVI
jgi:hypothetical protein